MKLCIQVQQKNLWVCRSICILNKLTWKNLLPNQSLVENDSRRIFRKLLQTKKGNWIPNSSLERNIYYKVVKKKNKTPRWQFKTKSKLEDESIVYVANIYSLVFFVISHTLFPIHYFHSKYKLCNSSMKSRIHLKNYFIL